MVPVDRYKDENYVLKWNPYNIFQEAYPCTDNITLGEALYSFFYPNQF